MSFGRDLILWLVMSFLLSGCLWLPSGRVISYNTSRDIIIYDPYMIAHASALSEKDDLIVFAALPFEAKIALDSVYYGQIPALEEVCPNLIGRTTSLKRLQEACPALRKFQYILLIPDIADSLGNGCREGLETIRCPIVRSEGKFSVPRAARQMRFLASGGWEHGMSRLCANTCALGIPADHALMIEEQVLAIVVLNLSPRPVRYENRMEPRLSEASVEQLNNRRYFMAWWTWFIAPFWSTSGWPPHTDKQHSSAPTPLDTESYIRYLQTLFRRLVARYPIR